ncbi:hypothetical protein FOB58_000930 [Candida parapsilosis]|uniref:Uncharacterized protein n=2 Tax=Candida parapsilosis TaxID=5480 RepID=G8BG60_CANPC|nr:uncharacterized protein CPAR2_204870 [Candida parapsilosis]KAF6055008.1 hypothetical protein FOB58_000930 [Candida parapsilosis]KAF6055969.1 hypothetical protein FOB59_000481 [Candida parapsilosis]KAF6058899.1 hypothetical protein FOB60_000481 [Candida parapsilosis]KAF6067656.1 hypothetical protein FOB61_000481 [Candida parapsilosis]KAI5901885.1 Uncharacterized protein K4G60_g1024 [Candida parapsilosis]
MSSEFEADGPQSDEELDYPLRIVLVTDEPKSKESEMEEILVDTISSFKLMHAFFDAFDEAVAIPNEGHIKYEVGSDGLVVIIVDDTKLKDSVVKFVEEYDSKLKEKEEKEERREEEELQSKKKKSKSNA